MYESRVGLEIHIQLATESKVFCSCRAAFGDEPNTNVCPVCMGLPGTLPTLNYQALHMAYRVARALNCEPARRTEFARKNYFYPDLPKNYQISQYGTPVGRDGYIDLQFHGKTRRVRITECHLEEDAGKMIHAGDMSLLDYNRTGTPLLEIVTEPDLELGEEAEMLLLSLRRMVRYLGVCDGNMEQGSLRCDANVSVNPSGAGLGNKVEIKNLNSSRFVRRALAFEIDRQTDILDRGGTVRVETRLWNENRDQSEPMRTKETAEDYRYFPEPDLPRVEIDDAFLASVDDHLVELPIARVQRFKREYGLSERVADLICEERSEADWFERCVAAGADPGTTATWLGADVRKQLNRRGVTLPDSPLTPERLASLLSILAEGRIHGKIAKQTLEAIFDENKDPETVITEKGWEQITDPVELRRLADEVVAAHPEAVEQIRGGDSKPIGFLVGQAMQKSAGRAEPKRLQQALRDALSVTRMHVLDFGGAIGGTRREDGMVQPGNLPEIRRLVQSEPDLPDTIRFEEVKLGGFLSEEVTPGDWAALCHAVATRLTEDPAGIVVAHGTDTLGYTAALLHWFFAEASVPIVLTAAPTPDDAVATVGNAVREAMNGAAGVHVLVEGRRYPALNLRFEAVVGDRVRFRTWNDGDETSTLKPLHRIGGLAPFEAESFTKEELTSRFEKAVTRIHIARVYPGMRSDSLVRMMEAGYRYFILELYDTGTANVAHAPWGLRAAFDAAKSNGAKLYGTSQQEGRIDFSRYVTSHELWREGVIPMGRLTTESAYTRLIAALVSTGESADAEAIMEEVV
ncbi:MAG: Asp-tRNA(Asn)/Glu-tRNA(Gln) amidotransferase subunit GatB [Spirochaetales bacterium]